MDLKIGCKLDLFGIYFEIFMFRYYFKNFDLFFWSEVFLLVFLKIILGDFKYC